jgi:hypothetical protein
MDSEAPHENCNLVAARPHPYFTTSMFFFNFTRYGGAESYSLAFRKARLSLRAKLAVRKSEMRCATAGS